MASCLPQEKTTQCSSGEAFDASQRKCISTLSSTTATISSITPSTSYTISTSDTSRSHAITVSDPTGSGYSVKWIVVDPNGNTTLLGTGLSLTFNHTSFTPGVYILEVQILDTGGSTVSDSRSWSVNIIDKQTPSIIQVTGTPFSTTITSAPTTINATINNPDLISNVNYEWLVNGSVIAGNTGSFSTSSLSGTFSFNPTSSSTYYTGANVYTVQLVLKENITGVVYTSASWTISNSIPGFASPVLGNMSLFPGNDTPASGSIITAIDKLNTPSGGFIADLNGDGDTNSSEKVDFCVQISNTTAADDTLGIDGDGVFIDFLSNGIVIATSQFTAEATPICLGVLNSVFFQSLPANIEAESQSIKAIVYDKFTGNSGRTRYKGFTEILTFDWPTRVRQKNTAPRIVIDDQNSAGNANNSTTNQIYCSTKTTTTHSNCEITQGARLAAFPYTEIPFKVGVTIDDDDYDSSVDFSKFRVEFYLDGTLLDGTHPLSSSDCFYDFGEVASAANYICSISINPYSSSGPIDPTGLQYTVTAKVTDVDSPFIVSTKESNTLTWRISTVNDFNTGINVNAFANAPAADNSASYVRKGGSNVTLATDQISELDNITFHVSVDDLERDSFNIIVERCTDILNLADPCATTTQVASVNYNSSSSSNPKIVPIAHTISQNAIDTINKAVASNVQSIKYRFIVTDTDGATPATATEVALQIVNKNENPTFNPSQFSPSLPLASSLIAFTGFPMSFDPGPVTDGTLNDGKNLKYQWLINVDTNDNGNFTDDAGFVAIPGATSRVLIWSPGQELDFAKQEGIEVKLKLCVGDDGLIDGGIVSKNPEGQNSCPVATLDTADASYGVGEWDVTVYSNMAKGRSHQSGAGNNSYNSSTDHPNGEAAIWVDPRSTNPLIKYMVYVNRSREIVVEKIVTKSNGAKVGSTQTNSTTDIEYISFPHSTDANFANNIVTNLSVTGDTTNNYLYIAYMAPISGTDQVHVRRINIGGGKTAFQHDGKLGFDKSYNGLLTSPNPLISDNSGNINITQDASTNGLVEIEFTAIPTLGVSVVFNGFTLGSLATLSAGTDFCGTGGSVSGCSTTAATAASFASAINSSSNNELQGITATNIAGTNIVTLQGMADGEFLESNLGAQDLGQIYINTNLNKWVLPYINGNLPAPNKNKVSLYTGDLNIRLSDSNASSTHLTSTNAADEIANDIDANERIILAIKREVSGEISVYELDNFHNIVDGSADLFSDPNITNIKVAVSKETSEFDQAAFITGTNQNSRLAFARIDSSADDFNFLTAVVRSDLDPSYGLIDGITNYDITAGTTQDQMLMVAVVDSDSNGTADEAVMLQVTGSSSPTIDCSFDAVDTQNNDKCMRITTNSTTKVFDLKVTLSDLVEDVTLGTDGATSNESTNDIVALVYQVDDGGGVKSDDALPIVGILNVSGTTLTTDENSNKGKTSIIPYVR